MLQGLRSSLYDSGELNCFHFVKMLDVCTHIICRRYNLGHHLGINLVHLAAITFGFVLVTASRVELSYYSKIVLSSPHVSFFF